jgi:DUF438 domain-containing protein
MPITSATTIYSLVEEHPYLKEWLIAYNPHFESLRNPVLFNTMARTATLGIAATMAGVSEEQLLDDVRTQIAQHHIIADETSGTASAVTLDADESARRAEQLKGIIKKLHDGASVASVKAEFDALAQGIDSVEIARMEQALIAEGMPVEEVQRLCDVHVSVFKDSLDVAEETVVDGDHPIDAYRRENVVATQLVAYLNLAVSELKTATDALDRDNVLARISAKLGELAQIDTHYTRKENQLFPVLEAHDVVGPTKVMWALDDDIRGRIKSARALVAAGDVASLLATLPDTLTMIDDMVYKEEKILFPTALGVVTAEEWASISAGDGEIGYAWVEGPAGEAARSAATAATATTDGEMLLPLPTGALTLAQLDLLFRALPFDVTYVDSNDRVRFYSEGERVFPRSPGSIGREVRNCHPPKSLDKVEQILAEFKAGTKDEAEFWIEMGPRFVHIRYFALRDADGAYQGCLEVVHDATHVRSLSGNRRIVDW